MTSKFSIDNRELLQRISSGEAVVGIDFGNLIVRELAAFRLDAIDSEPDRNPVLAYADSYRDMAKQGVESVPIWSVITDLERNVAPLYRHAQPAPAVPEEITIETATIIAYGLPTTNIGAIFKAGHDACRAAKLKAQPQNAPQNAPQNIPEIIPDCWCRTCRPVVLNDMRFVVCPDCGNKICPRANDHKNACTGSNEPGQEGSAYPDISREVK
ncbi:TPA: hypothetical protein ACXEV9_004090 [Klebsiella pneumoniae]